MTTSRIGIGFAIALWMLIGPFSLVSSAGENSPDAATKLIERMDRLENRVTDLEAQVVTLKREKTEAQESLKHQQEADAALKAQMARQTASAAIQPSSGTSDRSSRRSPATRPRQFLRCANRVSRIPIRAEGRRFLLWRLSRSSTGRAERGDAGRRSRFGVRRRGWV